jgi:Protein of unknown function (DUF2958)
MATLISDEDRVRLLDNGAAAARGERGDPLPVVKLVTLDAHATWLLTELDPQDGDTAFGLCDLGVGAPTLGQVKLSVLERIRGSRDLPVRCDRHFRPARRLSEYVQLAQADGSIND